MLNEAGPCELPELSFVVSVNTTTLELECIKQNPDLFSRFNDDECLRGSKRSIQGKC